MTLRLIRETETGIEVSDGAGWREPYPGEFVAMPGGNFLDLNGERAAIAWLKGIAAGVLVALAAVAVVGAVVAERAGS